MIDMNKYDINMLVNKIIIRHKYDEKFCKKLGVDFEPDAISPSIHDPSQDYSVVTFRGKLYKMYDSREFTSQAACEEEFDTISQNLKLNADVLSDYVDIDRRNNIYRYRLIYRNKT